MKLATRIGLALARPIRRWRMRNRQKEVEKFRKKYGANAMCVMKLVDDSDIEMFLFGNRLEEL